MNLKVRKRDGKLQDFNGEKIVNATRKAFEETKESYEKVALSNVVDYVYGAVKEEEIVDIEEIQDYVETFLIENQYVKTAKAYILYRAERSKYHKKDSNGLLSNEFLSKYKKAKEPFNQLGSFVFYRTYSRFLPEEGRRERWWETVRRAVEYNCSLAPTPVDEAEKLYDNIFNLKQVLSGRTMFTGNTEASKLYPMSNFNCCGMVMDNLKKYGDLFYLLLVGAGVGIRVLKSDVDKLPLVRGDINLINEQYKGETNKNRSEYTSLKFKDDFCFMEVGDSKEGK